MTPIFLQRFTSARRLYLKLTIGMGCFLLALVAFIGLQPFAPVEYIMRDPASIANQPVYYGALSNLGVLLWSASVGTCLLGALIAKALSDRWDIISFFAAFSGLSAFLCLDDLFQFHELLLPGNFGIPEEVLFVAYAIALLTLLIRFRKIILETQPILLGISLLLFALSIASDILPLPTNLLLEDGSKFMAIFAWFAYFVWAAVVETTQLANRLLTSTQTAPNIQTFAGDGSH